MNLIFHDISFFGWAVVLIQKGDAFFDHWIAPTKQGRQRQYQVIVARALLRAKRDITASCGLLCEQAVGIANADDGVVCAMDQQDWRYGFAHKTYRLRCQRVGRFGHRIDRAF